MRRVWHPYTAWEEVPAGMWFSATQEARPRLLAEAIAFTGNAEKYGSAMMRVIVEWPVSCEHNLTDLGQNRKAWIGHAACCLAIGCPEDITRAAWGHLSQQQQDDANARAEDAILAWERAHVTGQSEMFAR